MTQAERLVNGKSELQKNKTRWSQEEILFLRLNYPSTSTNDVAEAIGRPIGSITKMAQVLGVKKTAEAISKSKRESALKSGNNSGQFSKSHGLATSKNSGHVDPTYGSWLSMIQRCYYRKHKSWENYGGRGISVCDKWREFLNFRADMGERPKGMTIDRIDSDGNYEPNNCRWADAKTQQRNRKSNRRISALGKTMTLAEWSEETGIRSDTIAYRLKNGWSTEEALTLPSRSCARWARMDCCK